ncbi:hypothetical protein [Stenotrophomonas sp.]|uniref:hypothetical protein n=1 Tax=Stenotrophomonas sp. TaxID=69392 RepID=UPI0028A6EFD6|nr:hypothetical protein [Stenotrophomonas sp.]
MRVSVDSVYDEGQVDFSKFDLVILSITGESRGWLVSDKIRGTNAQVWALARRNENLTSINLEMEIERRIPSAAIVLAQSFASTLSAFMANAPQSIRIFIDVSCMTRKDMALAFDEIFSTERDDVRSITVSLGYVISKFVPPESLGCHNEDIRPISPRFAGWPSDPYAPTSVVMGLGYEAAKAEGANEYFDAQETWVFFPRSPIKEFDDEVLKNNKQMVDRASRESKLVYYPVDKPMESFFYLNSLVQDLTERSNLLILPFGPKIFAAIAMLVAIANPSVGVWHATGDTDLPADDHEASDHFVTMEVTFSARSRH